MKSTIRLVVQFSKSVSVNFDNLVLEYIGRIHSKMKLVEYPLTGFLQAKEIIYLMSNQYVLARSDTFNFIF